VVTRWNTQLDKLECVKVLLAAGADIHATDNRGWGVLHCSAWLKEPGELIKLLLDHATARGRPLNINARDKKGRTPLMRAAKRVEPAVVKALLAAGADVTAVDSQGLTALHFVGRADVDQSDFEQVYQLLISAGGDVFALDNDSDTPLQLALEQHAENPEVVQVMQAGSAGAQAQGGAGQHQQQPADALCRSSC